MLADAPVYRGYTLAELDRQYDVENSVAGWTDITAVYASESDRVRRRLGSVADIAYGPGEREKLDLFGSFSSPAPVQLFFHGGGWCAGSKEGRVFPAESFVARGAIWASAGYPLAPAATIDEIVAAARRAIVWAHHHLADHGGDPRRLFVTGNSAGAHLTAMLLTTDWAAVGLPDDVIKGACLISGPGDLTPHALVPCRSHLGLDPAMARRNSPLLVGFRARCPLLVVVGEDEADEYRRQSASLHEAWQARGLPSRLLVLPGENHFSILRHLNDPSGPLLPAMFAQMGLGEQ